MKFLLFCAALLSATTLAGQQVWAGDTAQKMEEVIISGFQIHNSRTSSLNIVAYPLNKVYEAAPYNLSDALAKLPGIAQMTTGNAISKPVIRGLYGNRILVLLSGIRFDNQQWQDEHGLGLSQIGIKSVEVIKGPASLIYGSDAMGGVINVIEEQPEKVGIHGDIGAQLFSNTRGILGDAGISKKTKNRWWRARMGWEHHADYSDGNNNRVLNSRNSGYYLKAGLGFQRKNWTQENTGNLSYNQYGFIIDDLSTYFPADSRWSGKFTGPHHNVLLALVNSMNTFQLKNSLLKLNLGVQSNSREEDEGGGQISLNMHLFSLLQNLKWEKDISEVVSMVANQQFTFEQNTNYGIRVLVPDAVFYEENLSVYFKFNYGKLKVETGAGVNEKSITTFRTKSLNAPGEPVKPFNKNNTTGNIMVGLVYAPTQAVTFKTNTATGFRAPNLAELSSNGLHEGVYRYEIGDPNLKTEQNINSDISVEIEQRQFFCSVSAFNNRFFNYVYLAPTTERFYSFPVYRYRQENARLYGMEGLVAFTPGTLKQWTWKEMLTLTRGKLDDGENLPFIPATKLTSSIRWSKNLKGKVSTCYFEPGVVNVFGQRLPAQFETPTDAYYLINCNAGIKIKGGNGDWSAGLACTNISNTSYVDHLSRLKYFGLNNTGRNITITVRKNF